MIKVLLTILVTLLSTPVFSNFEFNEDCSLENEPVPLCYHKRKIPTIYTAILHYGNAMKVSDLSRISKILEKRFKVATHNKLEVKVIHQAVIPLLHKLPKDFTFNGIKDKKRLHRIWYYENVGANVLEESYNQYKRNFPGMLKKLDTLLVITEAQFNALGFAYGRISATEYPMEIAWNLPNQGRTSWPTDYRIVDEFIHELGHNLFLGHAGSQCQNPKFTVEQRRKCIENSPSKNDVMSYSRDRRAVDENFMHGFEACNLGMLEKSIVPNILSGGIWRFQDRVICK